MSGRSWHSAKPSRLKSSRMSWVSCYQCHPFIRSRKPRNVVSFAWQICSRPVDLEPLPLFFFLFLVGRTEPSEFQYQY